MSEPIPEAIPTSADPRSHRPVKKARGPTSGLATSSQARTINALFADPDREIKIPDPASSKKSNVPPPPEIVANVQGSSAGAGSGEFHVYKASRRREYERLREMDAEAKKEEEDAQWKREEAERRKKDEERTAKNRAKRSKKKVRGKGNVKDDATSDARLEENGTTSGVGNPAPGRLQVPQRDEEATADGVDGAAATAEDSGVVIHDDG